MVNSKRKGGQFERDIAKTLSIWMFNDSNVLKREPTSGATKCNYSGDVFPMKQIDWSNFPFIMELKTGYEEHTPTFYKYTQILNWFNKSNIESHQHNQYIIFLICRFKSQPILLFTNYQLQLDKIVPLVIIPNQVENEIQWIYTYKFKDLLELNFLDLFGSEISYRR